MTERPSARRPRGADVARFAGVSESAVSRTFRDGASISPATRARVLSAAKSLGYRPNELARTITTKRSGVVAVIIHGGMLLYYPEVLVELSRAVTQAGMRVMLFTIEYESEIAGVVDQILGYQIDGAIMLNRVPAELLTTLSEAGVAVVLYNRENDGNAVDSVDCEHAAAGRTLARRLIGLGHRSFALVTGPTTSKLAQQRAAGVRDALVAAGLGDGLIGEADGDFTYEGGVAAAAMLIARDRHPTALIAINDAMALGALDHARSIGLLVPADMSVAGFDGSAVMHWLAYDLETMVQPVRRVARAAAEMLGRRIADPDPHPERRVFSYSLRAGVTVGTPNGSACCPSANSSISPDHSAILHDCLSPQKRGEAIDS